MRRMFTFAEMYQGLKSWFVDKTNIEPSLPIIKKITSAQAANILLSDVVQNYGGVIYVADSLTANENSALFLISKGSSSYSVTMLKNQGRELPFLSSFPVQGNAYLSLYLANTSGQMVIKFNNVTNIATGLGGVPVYGIENSTLHIKGTFTPTQNIAAGTKLFSTSQTLTARMTHSSAINSGAAGAETFVGISIQTNGDVYCLGALTSGVAYNIAVTATL